MVLFAHNLQVERTEQAANAAPHNRFHLVMAPAHARSKRLHAFLRARTRARKVIQRGAARGTHRWKT